RGPGTRGESDRLGPGGRGACAVGQNLAGVIDDVLSRLVLEARQDLQRRRSLMGSDQLELAVAAYEPKDFLGALRRPALALIAAALEPAQLRDLVALTKSRGIAALVEVHDEDETAAALEAGAQAIGVNHRNLRDFSIDLGLTERLRKMVPKSVVLVAESGIQTPADARRM